MLQSRPISGGEGWRNSNNLYTGGAPPRGPTPYPFYTTFHEKDTYPFRISSTISTPVLTLLTSSLLAQGALPYWPSCVEELWSRD